MWNNIHTKMWAPVVLGYEALLLGNRFLVFRRNISAFQILESEYLATRFHIYKNGVLNHTALKTSKSADVSVFYSFGLSVC